MGWWGGGGDYYFEGGDYFKYFHLRDTIIINRGTAIIRGNMVVWVACTIKGRGGKVQKGKGRGSSRHKNLCFCILPTRFPNVKSTVTKWPSTFHFSVYPDVNNVLEKGITDSWGQIPPKSKHHSPQNSQDWIPPNKNGNYVMGLAQYIYENERQAASSTCQFQGDFSVVFLIFFRGFHINIKRNDQQL